VFNDQVLEFFIPAHAPPRLEQLFQVCDSLDSWLRADPRNIAVVHCSDGIGRTGVVVACYLRFARFFETGQEALAHFAAQRSARGLGVRMPSQRRYVLYFCDVLAGSRSSTNPVPVCLRRVVMCPVPAFGTRGGCRPYMQIFQDGKEVYNSARGVTRLKKYTPADGSILLELDVLMRGDITITLTHVGIRRHITMCRFSFHTAFVPSGVLRLTPRQLDGKRALSAVNRAEQRRAFLEAAQLEAAAAAAAAASATAAGEQDPAAAAASGSAVSTSSSSSSSSSSTITATNSTTSNGSTLASSGAPPALPAAMSSVAGVDDGTGDAAASADTGAGVSSTNAFARRVAELSGPPPFDESFFMDLIFEHEGVGPAPNDATAWDVMRGRTSSGAVVDSGAAFVNLAEPEAENEWRTSAGGSSS
jgi:hypothetical protein